MVNLPDMILVGGGEVSQQHRTPQSAFSLKSIANRRKVHSEEDE
ncbi:hypothetical protein [Microcoleus sp. herbarium14]